MLASDSAAGSLSARRLARSYQRTRSLPPPVARSGTAEMPPSAVEDTLTASPVAVGTAAEVRILSALDERLVERLLAQDIRLVSSAWLLQASVTKLPTRQELEKLELELRGGEAPLLSGAAAAELVLRGDRSAGALSHGWLMGGDCDPNGHRLALVKRALQDEPHVEAIFWE